MAAEGKQPQALLDQLDARLLHTESLGHVHLAGGDYNASLFPEARKGYSNSLETKEADAFKNSLSTLSAQSLGGQGTLKEACSHDVAHNLLRPLDWMRSECMLVTTSCLKILRNVQLKALNFTSTLLITVIVV